MVCFFVVFFLILEMDFLHPELINNPQCLQNVLSIQSRLELTLGLEFFCDTFILNMLLVPWDTHHRLLCCVATWHKEKLFEAEVHAEDAGKQN